RGRSAARGRRRRAAQPGCRGRAVDGAARPAGVRAGTGDPDGQAAAGRSGAAADRSDRGVARRSARRTAARRGGIGARRAVGDRRRAHRVIRRRIALLATLALFACQRGRDETVERVVEHAIAARGREAKVTIDRERGAIRVDLGGAVKPADWPSAVPLYPHASRAKIEKSDGAAQRLAITTDDSAIGCFLTALIGGSLLWGLGAMHTKIDGPRAAGSASS